MRLRRNFTASFVEDEDAGVLPKANLSSKCVFFADLILLIPIILDE
jgi:hypothetical protein